jgi:hypothetical protein
MRKSLLVAASAATLGLLAFTPAMAQPGVGGYVGAGYSNDQFDHGFGHQDNWTVNGAAAAALGSSQFTIQGDGSYTNQHGTVFGTVHNSDVDLSLIWNHPTMGKIGATVGRLNIGAPGGPVSFGANTYGGFAVLYPNNQWTVGAKGGTVQIGSGFPDSTVWGAEVVGYPMPNLGLSLTADSADHVYPTGTRTDSWGLGAEWEPTAAPWSVKVGYDNHRFNGIGLHDNAWSLNFRWYFGGGSTLVSHHRDGAETWGTRETGYRSIF